jgi:hypothetical protein
MMATDLGRNTVGVFTATNERNRRQQVRRVEESASESLGRPRAKRLHRNRLSTTFLVSIVAVVALVNAAPASANVSHALSANFGSASGSPVNPYPLSAPGDVEVDQTSGDLYVTDPGNHRIEKFDSAGNFILMFGREVNKTAVENGRPAEANVCPAAGHPGDVCKTGVSASTAGAFATPGYIAVDNSGGASTGDVYIADVGNSLVSKFDSSGKIILNWGPGGRKDGSDALDLPGFGSIFGITVGGPNSNLSVGAAHFGVNILEYTPDGAYIPPYGFASGGPLKSDAEGNYYMSAGGVLAKHGPEREAPSFQVGTATPLTGFNRDPSTGEIYQDTGTSIAHYDSGCPTEVGPCEPLDSFGSSGLFGANGVAVDGETHTVYVANSTTGDIAVFGDVRPFVTTGQQSVATESEVTLTGHIDPAGRGNITSCYFEYGYDQTYGHTVPCSPDPASSQPASNFTGPTDVTATVTGLSSGTRNHYRLVAGNAPGATSFGSDEVFSSSRSPIIDGLIAENLTATSADIEAQVNPVGLETTYRVEYGTTTEYGHSAPTPEGTLGASISAQGISVHLEGLTPRRVYHYRLVATNGDGTTTVADHTFNFYPPECPNSNVRQQTQANYLPDCRAYELVSPGNANGTQLYPGGPNAGDASVPSRFSFSGLWGTIPNSGGSPSNSTGDLYVATRTPTRWVSRYVGLPGDKFATSGGPPQGLPGFINDFDRDRAEAIGFRGDSGETAGMGYTRQWPDKIQGSVLTDLGMNSFLVWNDNNGNASGAPYVFGADGELLDRWPTNLNTVPDGLYPLGLNAYSWDEPESEAQPQFQAPGGAHALDCPPVLVAQLTPHLCAGDVNASADLSHFVFATEWNVFAPGGQVSPPGSVYDNDTASRTVEVASRNPAGDAIPPEPTNHSGDPLQIPDVSTDGSHILIAAGGVGPCGYASCPSPPCGYVGFNWSVQRCPLQPSHLYMRVDGNLTYDVSRGYAVDYVGMTDDGAVVYFTSSQGITNDDTDTSTDLYRWSEASDTITLASKGQGSAGNTDACNSSFVDKCGVVTYSNAEFCELTSGLGGNCLSDNSIAAESGDIYFFSPEQLVGTRGIANQENVYLFRDGAIQYVTTLNPRDFYCTATNTSGTGERCSESPIARMQVSPDGKYMAFLTVGQVTLYDNAGHSEMYLYEPDREKVLCVSCIPSGAQPTSDVVASQNGLFMTDDGRAFFTTDDPLVHIDTNEAQDVYEYVDGHAQLISPGTGDTRIQPHNAFVLQFNLPGLIGVSADGTDVYFSTNQTLVSQDHNGLFLKFYDARTGGGFPAPAPPPPCEAADECHGPSSLPLAPLQDGSGVALGNGGNATPAPQKPGHKRRKHRKRRHTRPTKRAKSNQGGHAAKQNGGRS